MIGESEVKQKLLRENRRSLRLKDSDITLFLDLDSDHSLSIEGVINDGTGSGKFRKNKRKMTNAENGITDEFKKQKTIAKKESATVICFEIPLTEDISFSDDCCPDQVEVDEILAICAAREHGRCDDIYSRVTLIEYTGQNDKIWETSEATYNCHNCEEFSTGNYSDLYDHLSGHHKELVLKVFFSLSVILRSDTVFASINRGSGRNVSSVI